MQEIDRGIKLSEPFSKPDVPEFAERMSILEHVRHQFHPLFLNAIGGPDVNGPKQYLGIEIRCPFCRMIQELGPPGVEGKCIKCDLRWKYTAAKGNSWIWIWRAKPAIVIKTGEGIDLTRAYHPDRPRDPNSANSSQSGFLVNVNPRRKDE